MRGVVSLIDVPTAPRLLGLNPLFWPTHVSFGFLHGLRLPASSCAWLSRAGGTGRGGLSGVIAGDMQLLNIGVIGYAAVFPAATAPLVILFYRTPPIRYPHPPPGLAFPKPLDRETTEPAKDKTTGGNPTRSGGYRHPALYRRNTDRQGSVHQLVSSTTPR